jgi:outer membrane protein assembly factor BamB
MRRLLLLSSFSLLALTLSASAADWARFRGPNGSGVADGTMPTIDPKAPLWKVAVPGKGNGSPIVAGGKVYLQTASADGKTRSLLCLDAATGKTEWAKDVPGKTAHTHALNSLASSTPACDGERLYCVWWDGEAMSVHAYDLAGKELWAQSLGSFKSQHGVGHSPAVHGGKVFVNFDQDDAAAVVALDAKTGSRVWSAERKPERACYTTPAILEQPGKPAAVLVYSTHAIDSYDPDTGKVNWHYSIAWPAGTNKLRSIGAPVLTGGMAIGYFGEGGGKGSRYALAVKTDGAGDVTGTAKVWDARKNTPYVPGMLARGDYLFWVYDTGGRMFCAEAKTGKVVWDEEILKQTAVYSSPVLVGDRILVIAETGQVSVVKADKTFTEPTTANLGEKVIASPAVADGKVFVRGVTHLYCFGKK